MIVRFQYAKTISVRDPAKHKKYYGNFVVKYSSPVQQSAAEALYEFMIQPGDASCEAELMRLTHTLLDVLWRSKNSRTDDIANPIDQSICLSTMRPDHQWSRANTFTRYCAQVQHGGYSTMTQIARLIALGEDSYSPVSYSPVIPTESTPDVEMRLDDGIVPGSGSDSEPDADSNIETPSDADSNIETPSSNAETASELDADSNVEIASESSGSESESGPLGQTEDAFFEEVPPATITLPSEQLDLPPNIFL